MGQGVTARRCGTDLVPTAVIKMMVGGNTCDNLDAGLVSGSLDLGDVVGIYGCGFVGRVVNEEIRVVVVADGDRDDLHSDSG